MLYSHLKRTHRLLGAGLAGAVGHSMSKYRKKKNVGRRTKLTTRARRRTSYGQRRRGRLSRRRKRAVSFKKAMFRKARKRQAFKYFCTRRTNKISMAFDMSSGPGPDYAQPYLADVLWYGETPQIKQFMKNYRHHRMRSLSFKYNNFKCRTLMRTVTTEGDPPQEYTTEQIIEPSNITVRYRWDKWGENVNPGTKVGHDYRIEENMQSKCITNCKQKFWGIWKPKGQIPTNVGPRDGDHSWDDYVTAMDCRNRDANGPPQLKFWFAVEGTLPDQFFKPDPPVVRTAKIFLDFDSTFYTKWFVSNKKLTV